MHSMRVWSAGIIIAVVLLIGFVLSVPHLRDTGAKRTADSAAPLPIVYFHDVYKKGVHTLTVKVAAPNACTVITGDASAFAGSSSSTPDTIQIALDMPQDSGTCLQVPATTTLSLTATAAASASFAASINGTVASTTRY